MTSTQLLAMLATGVFALPATIATPVQAQVAPVVAAFGERVSTAIADQAGFDAALEPGGFVSQAVGRATPTSPIEVTLSLANGLYRMPSEIDFPNVHLVITSASPVTPVGVEHRDKDRDLIHGATFNRLNQLPNDPDYTVGVRSPLTIKNVNINNSDSGDAFFTPEADLTIDNVLIFNQANAADPYFVRVVSDDHAPTVSIMNSRFNRVRPLEVIDSQGKTRVERNVLIEQGAVIPSINFAVRPGHKPFSNTADMNIVRNNYIQQLTYNTAVKANRSGITVDHNEFFVIENGSNPSIMVQIDPFNFYHSGQKLEHIAITNNVLKGVEPIAEAYGLELSHSENIADQTITVSGNDFSKASTAVRAFRHTDWLSDAPIVFTGNFVGNARNDLLPASVADPKATTPPGAGLQGNIPPLNQPPVQPPAPPAPRPPIAGPPALPAPPAPLPVPTPQPSTTPTQDPIGPAAPRTSSRHAGETRFETATAISKELFPRGTDSVIIARADNAADSVTAAPLAKALNAPVLLTQSDQLHPAVASELARLMPKGGQVILMGGEVALNNNVAQAITKAGHKVERIAGPNRAATAVTTANRLAPMGKAKQMLVVDGADWQPTLIAGPAAAANDGVIVLTNGNQMAPETLAHIQANANTPLTPVGANAHTATDKSRLTQPSNTKAFTTKDPVALSIEVAKAMYSKPQTVGVATTADFADALAGGTHIAHKNGPILLTPAQLSSSIPTYLDDVKTVTKVHVYGGPTRISDQVAYRLTTQTNR